MISWSEIQYLLRTIVRWWWVILLATLTAAGTATLLSERQQPLFVTRATLQIGNSFESAQPEERSILLGGALAEYYAELARREVILRPVQEALGLPSWQTMRDHMVVARATPRVNLLEIEVTDSSAERAALIANMIGEELIRYSPTSPEKAQADQQLIDSLIRDAETQIATLKARIEELNAQSLTATSASDIREIAEEISQLTVLREQAEDKYRSLLQYSLGNAPNSLRFFERARPPAAPLPSRRATTIAFAALAGLLLSMLAVYSLDRLDDRWRGGRDIEDYFKMRSLGAFPIGALTPSASEALRRERERAIEELYTNIQLAAPERTGVVRTLLISSPRPTRERSELSLDLAQQYARLGYRVLIVDSEGSAPLLSRSRHASAAGGAGEWICLPAAEQGDVWVHLRPTTMPNITLLPGPLTDSSGLPALVPALRWPELAQHLRGAADVVIFDGPSALSSADGALLAPHVDGVILALNAESDARSDVAQSKARLLHWQASAPRLFGAVALAGRGGFQSFWRRLAPQSAPRQLAAPSQEELLEEPAAVGRGPTIITSVEEILSRIPEVPRRGGRERRATPAPRVIRGSRPQEPLEAEELLQALLS